jgi:hypothetical protein
LFYINGLANFIGTGIVINDPETSAGICCRLIGGERWCEIRATHSGAMGWVAGGYLVEAAAPVVTNSAHALSSRRPAISSSCASGTNASRSRKRS